MTATNAFETDVLELYFNNLDHPNVGDAAGLQNSASAGNFYVSLHTSNPGETGTQTTSEATYTGYGRVAVARSSAGWTISGNNVSNAAAVTFGLCTAGSETITHFGIGSDSTGAGNLFFFGALTASLAVSAGITPSFAIGELDVNCD
jgi:hypothetical protein